ncbi:MAG: hypothetical protein K6G40_07495 [Eubacterium sp.]|nr:hypothetical protein [Eubacterium sp.]
MQLYWLKESICTEICYGMDFDGIKENENEEKNNGGNAEFMYGIYSNGAAGLGRRRCRNDI